MGELALSRARVFCHNTTYRFIRGRHLPIATTLNLAVADYTDAQHWYWRLTDADGQFLADQEVNLNPSDAEYEGFLDLPSYLAIHAAPDRRRGGAARLG